MDLTGPTDAVELVRSYWWGWRRGEPNYLHVPVERPGKQNAWWLLACGYVQGRPQETVRASRADIRLGFVGDLCPECKAALEDGLDSRTREA